MSDRDDAAFAYYEDPEHRELTGPGRKRAGQTLRLTTHVPIRFSPAVIELVKELASEDGQTVSSWIRHVIDREVARRARKHCGTCKCRDRDAGELPGAPAGETGE